ncbi:hypothetical protein BDK51DRAFT_18468, partial [Blyttiomyces helicus]
PQNTIPSRSSDSEPKPTLSTPTPSRCDTNPANETKPTGGPFSRNRRSQVAPQEPPAHDPATTNSPTATHPSPSSNQDHAASNPNHKYPTKPFPVQQRPPAPSPSMQTLPTSPRKLFHCASPVPPPAPAHLPLSSNTSDHHNSRPPREPTPSSPPAPPPPS